MANFSAISRQNSSTSTLNDSVNSELDTSTLTEHDDNVFTNNCQISFIESLVEIGRKLVNQPNRESKTTRLGKGFSFYLSFVKCLCFTNPL